MDGVPIRLVIIEHTAKQMLHQVVGPRGSAGAGSAVWDVAFRKAKVKPAPGEQILVELAARGPYFLPLRAPFISAEHRLLEADEALLTEGQNRLEMFDPSEVCQLLGIETVQQRVH